MQLNWFTLIAQIVNFLILVWLLKHFLYSRILQVMDEREQHIAAQLDKAEQEQQEAEQEAEQYRKQQADFEESKQQALEEATEEAHRKREQMLEEARQEVNEQKKSWQKALKNDQQQILHTLRDQTQTHIQAIAANVLRELADADLETQIAQNFLQRLQHLDDESLNTLFQGQNGQQTGPYEIRSAFELSENMQSRIMERVEDLTERKPEVQFTTVPEMAGGLELHAHGMKIGWSIHEYLESLESAWKDELELQNETG